jgi:putative N-acetylmannosamine-6-phosphate epimerase
MFEIIQIHKGLIVSCQAKPGSPFRDPRIMVAMALAAQIGGAVGIRANGPEDIAAIHAAVPMPLIGIYKQVLPGSDVYITPTLDAARQVAKAGADVIALDATPRLRPGDLTLVQLIRAIKEELGVMVMADVSTLEEGIAAAGYGADLVATTLVGYTPYSHPTTLPDFELIHKMVKQIPVPLVVEGNVATPEDARLALDLGAYAVVVGAAITQPEAITHRFVKKMKA